MQQFAVQTAVPQTTQQVTMSVVVPVGVGQGGKFQVNVSGQLFWVQCPPSVTAGQTMSVTVPLTASLEC